MQPVAASEIRTFDGVVISAASAPQGFQQCLVAVEDWGQGAVLGNLGRARTFARSLSEEGICVRYAPLPEMFSSGRSFEALLSSLNLIDSATAKVLHLNFAQPEESRVLKGARNVLVCAGGPSPTPTFTSGHPLADCRHLPSGFEEVWSFGNTAFSLHALDGRRISAQSLPQPQPWKDSLEHGLSTPTIDRMPLSSLSEINRQRELGERSTSTTRFRYAKLSQDVRKVFVPLNIANPASSMFELLRFLIVNPYLMGAIGNIVIFPINGASQPVAVAIDLLGRIAREASDDAGQNFLFAEEPETSRIAAVMRWCDTCWLDADDPESAWSGACADAYGLPWISVSPQGSDDPATEASRTHTMRSTQRLDALGERIWQTCGWSERAIRRLVQEL